MNGDNLFAELNKEDKSRKRAGEGGNQSRTFARDSKRQKNEHMRSFEYTDLNFKTMLEKIKLSVAHLRQEQEELEANYSSVVAPQQIGMEQYYEHTENSLRSLPGDEDEQDNLVVGTKFAMLKNENFDFLKSQNEIQLIES